MIKKIYTFGTSCTAGGGFEFECKYPHRDLRGKITNKNRGDFIKGIYSETPYTQNNYSWPGQLQKLVSNDIQVINISKQGYGNERIYRKFYDIVDDVHFNTDESLFLFEFSDLSRKEFWHNPSNNHIIMNYLADDNDTDNCSLAKSYFYDNKSDRMIYNKDFYLFKQFRDNFMEVDNQSREISRNILIFINYLKYNKINFLITAPPELIHPYYSSHLEEMSKYYIYFGWDNGVKYNSFHRFADLESLRIIDETNLAYRDTHPSLFANKIISKNVFNKLIELNYIRGTKYQLPKLINFKENLIKKINI